jgi:hypothetical protein
MKKLIIATSILFAFSSAFAQKPNVKPKVSKYQSKTADAKPSKSVSASSEAKPSKPVGPSTKPAPVVKPTKAARPVGASTTRASQSAIGGGALKEKSNSPSKGVNKEKGGKNTMSNSRASQSSGGALKEKSNSPSKGVNKEKGQMNDSKAAASAIGGDNVKGKADFVADGDSKAVIDAEYCKGWNDGFSKAFPKSKRIPNCENNGKCKGYKCGYEAGMKKAESLMK